MTIKEFLNLKEGDSVEDRDGNIWSVLNRTTDSVILQRIEEPYIRTEVYKQEDINKYNVL